eukprot:TRINITY_DN10940_c0_g1_i1.p1 TRINITY_DN10940_c0_g1~~TRINITY_DN10940_c0_g1_i1.p1  ORF type:complete len:114 (+),score=27.45 TRINITY_DN10940_c0_g1_i1:9-350(+)
MSLTLKNSKGWLRQLLGQNAEAAQKTPLVQITELRLAGDSELSDAENFFACFFTDAARKKFSEQNSKRKFSTLKMSIISLVRFNVEIDKFRLVVDEFKFVGKTDDQIISPKIL